MTKELNKLIGHDMCRPIAPTVGQTVPLKAGIILHTFSKRDGKTTGSQRLEEDIQYTNIGTQDAYVKDQTLTNEWLENNTDRREWNGRTWRPAKPDEIGYVVSGINFNAPNYDPAGRRYDRIQPGQCLWTLAEDGEAHGEAQSDPDLELVVQEVVGTTYANENDDIVRGHAQESLKHVRRVRRIVKELTQ
jgi:hypothetical protein